MASPTSMASGTSLGGTACKDNEDTAPVGRLAPTDIPEFLQDYGFQALTAMDWRGPPPPQLSIAVTGHRTHEGHTLYRLECSLSRPGSSPGGAGQADFRGGGGGAALSWQADRRLSELRSGLHDPVRKALGSSYGTYFCGVHFAQRMRPSGTTSRLDTWCRRLAYCVSSKLVPPAIAAETLRLLGAPASCPGGDGDGGDVTARVRIAADGSEGAATTVGVAAGACGPARTPAILGGQGCGGATTALGVTDCSTPAAAAPTPSVSAAAGDSACAHDSVSTGTGGDSSSRGLDAEDSPNSAAAAGGFVLQESAGGPSPTSVATEAAEALSWVGPGDEHDTEEEDDDELTDEILRSGLPGLDS